MDEETRKWMDDVILESKRFIQIHKPPRQDKVGDFLSFTKRKFSDLAVFFQEDRGIDVLMTGRGKNRDVNWPPDIQIR